MGQTNEFAASSLIVRQAARVVTKTRTLLVVKIFIDYDRVQERFQLVLTTDSC